MSCMRHNFKLLRCLQSKKMRDHAHYFEFSAENARMGDWVAERSGFERRPTSPVHREIVREFGEEILPD